MPDNMQEDNDVTPIRYEGRGYVDTKLKIVVSVNSCKADNLANGMKKVEPSERRTFQSVTSVR